MKKQNKKKTIITVTAVVLVVAIGLGVWFGVSRGRSEPVKVFAFNYVGMTEYWGDSQESYGPVSTDKIQTVFLSSTQTVTEMKVAQGDMVKKGDVLMTFDTTLSDLQLERKRLEVEKLKLDHQIELDHISFHYPDSDKNIFEDAHMIVPKGKSVGIIGTSGAGKSTIVDILLGLLHAQTGMITCDGVDIFKNYESWLAQIGYIPQSIYLIDESIRDNIAFGIDADKIDEKRIWEVLEEAQLKEFVEELPEGLDTTIGDRGVRLSGGQRQRIGIARALYNDPEILVFDEATSALDNDTEAAVMEAVNSFHGRKTMIIIAHRLNTIEKCDMVYRVEGKGVVRER